METTTIDAKHFTERAPDLYLQTCGELKREIAESVREERQLERNSLLACGAVYTFLADKLHPFSHIVWYVPCAIALFGAYRTVVLMISIRPRGQYIKRVETMMLDGKALTGWETYFRSHYRFGVGVSIWFYWIVLISVTFVAQCYF
jgi:hypothetical protein